MKRKNKKYTSFRIIYISIIFVLVIGFVFSRNLQKIFAANFIDKTLSYQGRLTDSSGNPVADGSHDFCFSIWTDPNAGSKVWPTGTSTPMSATTSSGVFNVVIGSGTDDLSTLDFTANSTLYLQVEARILAGGTCQNATYFEPLLPRQQISASGFARAALRLMNTNRLLGRTTAGSGASEEISVAGTLSLSGGVLTGTGGASLSTLTAATTTPTILTNGNNVVTWNWAQTSNNQNAFTFGETTAASAGTAGNQYELAIKTLTSSTAAPLQVVARGNTIIDTTNTGGITLGNTTAAQDVQFFSSSNKITSAGALTVASTISGTQLISTIATGTAPFVVSSTTPVANLTAAAANGLNSATTTIAVSSATAPTIGQVLTATSSTAATWQNFPTTIKSLAAFYRAWANIGSSIVRIENLGDSILTCNQLAPCAFGPNRIGSTFALLLIDELAQRYQQYSTGFRPIVRLSNGSIVVSAGDGYVLTSGSITNSVLLGPQESGVMANGGSLSTLSSGGVITITVGQPYSSVNIACVAGTSITGYTVTIGGSSAGTACGSGSGSGTATIQNFVNPTAFASQPATGSTLTLTALGAINYLYAYEAVLFCGASNTACTTGFVVDNLGVGAASSPWFASGTKTGNTDGGMVWIKAFAGQVALGVLENGENDANSGGPVTNTQQNAQNQIVATDLIALNASVLWFGPPPHNLSGVPATYAALQIGSLEYCQAQGWVCLNMADLFLGDQSGTMGSTFPFLAQDTGQGVTPPWGDAQGLTTPSDHQHLSDCGELLVTQQFIETIFPMWNSYPVTQACSQNPLSSATSTAFTATQTFATIAGATANTGQLEFVAPIGQSFNTVCRGVMNVGTTGIVTFQVIGSTTVSAINATLSYQATLTAPAAFSNVSATALAGAMATSSITNASGLRWELVINGVNGATANSFAVQAKEASGTLTIPAGASCTTQLSGPQ
jgi:hypothetical protein